ncbi:MAG: capsule biosynthesis protein [Sphingobium sp.]
MTRTAGKEDGKTPLLWLADTGLASNAGTIPAIIGTSDPWCMLDGAAELWADGDDETLLVAALLGVPIRVFGNGGRFSALADGGDALNDVVEREMIDGVVWHDPYRDEPTDIATIIGYCAAWRQLIDANRPVAVAFGFGQWKRGTVDALLWNGGSDSTSFLSTHAEKLAAVPEKAAIALWKARVPAEFLALSEQRAGPVYEVEDGFIRSVGLGADCVPPLSIVVDPVGVHYDPARPSALENMLATGDFSPEMLARAQQLRRLIVESGISKYELGGESVPRPGGGRRHILVPGQVEDDRSVIAGGGDLRGNLDLLTRVRAAEPGAYILYKPHPDILSGHRKGHVLEAEVLQYADEIVTDQPISALLDMVDGVHVITSLAGFEALLRGKDVTTHGVPFYAGWGLTHDLGDVPARRRRKCTLDELVAATLLLYPRYLDPVSGLPCPPELLIERLKAGMRRENRAVVMLRRTQGNLRRVISRLGFAA